MDVLSQLGWIQKNHEHVLPVNNVGLVALSWLEQRRHKDVSVTSSLVATICRVVDDEFCKHCRVAGIKKGTLQINVDREELVQRVRLQWLLVLKNHFDVCCHKVAVTKIIFEYGQDGVEIELLGNKKQAKIS